MEGTRLPPSPPLLWDLFYAEIYGKIIGTGIKRRAGRIRQTDQPLSSEIQTDRASERAGVLGGKHVKQEEKRRQLVTDSLPKTGAKPGHKCDILASQTVRRWRKLFLPSWAGGSSAHSLARSLTPLSLVSISDCSHHKPCRTQELKKRRRSLPLPSLPSFSPFACFLRPKSSVELFYGGWSQSIC